MYSEGQKFSYIILEKKLIRPKNSNFNENFFKAMIFRQVLNVTLIFLFLNMIYNKFLVELTIFALFFHWRIYF